MVQWVMGMSDIKQTAFFNLVFLAVFINVHYLSSILEFLLLGKMTDKSSNYNMVTYAIHTMIKWFLKKSTFKEWT